MGPRNIERTTFFQKTSSLTLTFDHVTSESIGVIYSLGASTVPSLETFKQRSQEILSGHPLVYTLTDRPTGAKQYAAFFKGGGAKNT